MLKYIIVLGLALSVSTIGFAASDELHLGGTYLCEGYDEHDGGYKDDILLLTLDSKHSDFKHNFGAYHFQLSESDGKVIYLGEVAANGNTAAVYFANVDKAKSTDQGVGIATITHDLDQTGHANTIFHKFYYEPKYHGGGNGSETCIKQDEPVKKNK
ncbi:MAG: hypothetical protein V4496_02700 [Pseudomonadota bacterium]